MRIWFEDLVKNGPFEKDLAHEGIASLTYTCFLATITIEADGLQISRGHVRLLGFAEEVVKALARLERDQESLIDWLGGESPVELTLHDEWVRLFVGDEGIELNVLLSELKASVLEFASCVLDDFVEARPALMQNREFMELRMKLKALL